MSDDFGVRGSFSWDNESLGRAGGALRNSMGRVAGQIGQTFKSRIIAAFGASGVAFVIKQTLERGFEASSRSFKLGISSEVFQALNRMADRTGETVDELAKQFMASKAAGTDFARTVEAATGEMLKTGLISSTKQVNELAEAYVKLADVLAKIAPYIADRVAAVAGTVESVEKKGVMATIAEFMNLQTGRLHERIGKMTGQQRIVEEGLQLQLEASGGKVSDDGLVYGPPEEDPTAKLLRQLREQQQFEAWYESIGGNVNWSSAAQEKTKREKLDTDVSDLRKMGGYMTTGPATTPAEEQLRLINRKMDDLVAAGRKVAM